MMYDRPFISIGIPVYNAQEYVELAIGSILHQEYNDFEIICVNDGSTDQSAEILKKMAYIDPRIKVYHNARNSGIAITRKTILNKATGQFFLWIDADDRMGKGCLGRLSKFFLQKEHTNCILIQNAYIERKGNRKLLYSMSSFETNPVAMQEKMIVSNVWGSYPWTIVGRIEAFRAVEYPDNPEVYIDDQLVSYQYLNNADKVYFDSNVNYIHYLYKGSDSHSPEFYLRLSRTYEFIADHILWPLSEAKGAVQLMVILCEGLFLSKNSTDYARSLGLKARYIEVVRKLWSNKLICRKNLSFLNNKQVIQVLWMRYFPSLFYFYYKYRRML